MEGCPTRTRPGCVAIVAVVLLGSKTGLAGPRIVVGRDVPVADRIPIDRIDHRAWDRLLKQFVDQRGYVAYDQWKQSTAATRALDEYLATLSAADLTARSDPSARLAFWINAYNALTIRGILREYPTTSIRNHTAKVFGYNIWKDLLLQVGGQTYSLDQIEHQRLRKLGEPRIHFAIVCASVGCPRLLAEAYTAEQLDAQLTANARHFFANPNNFRYDASSRRFQLSEILDWFGTDFGSDQAAQLRAISPYLPDRAASQAAAANSGSVSFLKYDWSLNDQAPAARP